MANEDVIKEMPEYYAHKPVKAARLLDAFPPQSEGSDEWILVVLFPDNTERELVVNSEWMRHHEPNGGWIVVGADGQIAYSRAADFEPTFTKDAVIISKDGKDVFSREYLFERNAKGELVPKAELAVPVDEPVVDGL